MHASPVSIQQLFDALLGAWGPQQWWPAETPFEIAAGAVLVQRTAWRNAELAITALREAALLTPAALSAADASLLETLVRPAGFARAKARYLVSMAEFFERNGGIPELAQLDTETLRAGLLSVRGIGPETADAILLYLFARSVWVADAYAERILSRIFGKSCAAEVQRAHLRPWCDAGRVSDLQELHALLVQLGKLHCRRSPRCSRCPAAALCAFAIAAQ